ncbi:MAG: hypothetical protein J3R72DRAFT_486437 [Linnemannia gamsii]|nr:MAG: hypothetical protein J3R72DRAFT_486437 [Linnemannia gamsii]
MGADSYLFTSTTAAAIPVPKEALQRPFDLHGFKLMTVKHGSFDNKFRNEYYGAMICLADTELCLISTEVLGPYEIPYCEVACKRMKHLDALMPTDTRDRLVSAFETYTGRKADVMPGFWAVSDTSSYCSNLELHSTWSLDTQDRIAGKNCDRFGFYVVLDADGSDA